MVEIWNFENPNMLEKFAWGPKFSHFWMEDDPFELQKMHYSAATTVGFYKSSKCM